MFTSLEAPPPYASDLSSCVVLDTTRKLNLKSATSLRTFR